MSRRDIRFKFDARSYMTPEEFEARKESLGQPHYCFPAATSHTPFKTVGHFHARLQHVGQLQPRVIDMEDAEE